MGRTLLAVGFALGLAGCGGTDAPPPADAALDARPTADATLDAASDTSTDASTDTATADGTVDALSRVAFADVQAIFARSCAAVACHGSSRAGGLSLADGDSSFGAMVNQASQQVPRLLRVRPGNPDESWLLIKITGTMRTFAECAPGMGTNPCGARMPQLAAPLGADEEGLVRRWITEGAQRP